MSRLVKIILTNNLQANLTSFINLLRLYFVTPHFSGVPLTTRQPTEYSWMSGNPTPLTKIRQSLICMRNSTQSTKPVPIINNDYTGSKCSKIMATWAPASILTSTSTIYNSSRVITLLLTKTNIKIYNFNTCSTK